MEGKKRGVEGPDLPKATNITGDVSRDPRVWGRTGMSAIVVWDW